MTTLIFDILNLNTGYTLRVAYSTRPISFQLKILCPDPLLSHRPLLTMRLQPLRMQCTMHVTYVQVTKFSHIFQFSLCLQFVCSLCAVDLSDGLKLAIWPHLVLLLLPQNRHIGYLRGTAPLIILHQNLCGRLLKNQKQPTRFWPRRVRHHACVEKKVICVILHIKDHIMRCESLKLATRTVFTGPCRSMSFLTPVSTDRYDGHRRHFGRPFPRRVDTGDIFDPRVHGSTRWTWASFWTPVSTACVTGDIFDPCVPWTRPLNRGSVYRD